MSLAGVEGLIQYLDLNSSMIRRIQVKVPVRNGYDLQIIGKQTYGYWLEKYYRPRSPWY
jgi:hypothetical protein